MKPNRAEKSAQTLAHFLQSPSQPTKTMGCQDTRPSNHFLILRKQSTRSIKKLSATSTARPRIMLCPPPETRLSAQRRGRRAYRWELEPEKESDGGLCQVSDFVEV